MAEGNWIDTFYEPITEEPFTPGIKRVKYVGDEEITGGEFMVVDPYTPHGLRTSDRREVHGIMIAYIGALRQGGGWTLIRRPNEGETYQASGRSL
jgi:hypothetical protein